MNDLGPWRVCVYQMSNAGDQESVADLLARVNNLTVECVGAPDHLLIVGCQTMNQARSVHRLVLSTDPLAVIVHQTARMVTEAAP
jgi:hypothetical protein